MGCLAPSQAKLKFPATPKTLERGLVGILNEGRTTAGRIRGIMFKLGDIIRSKSLGCIGIVVEDPKDFDKQVVQIHPYVYGKIIESDWELFNLEDFE